jgi:hypothetical protein
LTGRIDVTATHKNTNNCRASIGDGVVVNAAIGGHDHAISKEDIGRVSRRNSHLPRGASVNLPP